MFDDIYNVGIDIVFELKKIIKFEEYTYVGKNEEQKETNPVFNSYLSRID